MSAKKAEAEAKRLELARLLAERPDMDATKLSLLVGRSKDYFRDFLVGRKNDVASEAWGRAMDVLATSPAPGSISLNEVFDPKDLHLLELAVKQLTGSAEAAPDLLQLILAEIYKRRPTHQGPDGHNPLPHDQDRADEQS